MLFKGARWCNENSHWAAVPAVGLLVFPSQWMFLGFLAALGLFAARWLATGNPLVPTPANLPLLVLLTMTAIGLAITPAPELAVLTAGQIVASVTVLFVVLDHVHSSADLWRGMAVVAALGILFTLAAPFTVRWTPDKVFDLKFLYSPSWPRLGKETNPNILAGALAIISPISLALLGHAKRGWRILGALSIAPMLCMLALLQSRGAIFGLAVGLAVWLTLHRPWSLPLIPVLLIGLLAFNNWSGGPPISQFVYGKVGSSTAGTLLLRQDMWIQSANLIRQFPWTGIGLGAYPRVGTYSWPYSAARPGPVANHAHNLFLQVALDTGLLGLSAFAVLFFIAAREAWIAWRMRVEAPLAIGLLASFSVVIAHGLGDVIVWGTAKPSVVLWILFGLSFGLRRIWVRGTGKV